MYPVFPQSFALYTTIVFFIVLQDRGVEDLDIGRCLYTVGVKAEDSVDDFGLERFHPLNFYAYFGDLQLPAWTKDYAFHPLKRVRNSMWSKWGKNGGGRKKFALQNLVGETSVSLSSTSSS